MVLADPPVVPFNEPVIKMSDAASLAQAEKALIANQGSWAQNFTNYFKEIFTMESGGKLIQSAMTKAAHEVAAGLATTIAWSGAGQKPAYYPEDWTVFTANVLDSAAGVVLDDLSKGIGFKVCDPTAGIIGQIGLGLVDYFDDRTIDCKYSTMKENWNAAINDPNFIDDFQSYFNPTGNSTGVALSIQNKALSDVSEQDAAERENRKNSDNWNYHDGPSRTSNMPPGTLANEMLSTDIGNYLSIINQTLPPEAWYTTTLYVFAQQLALETFRRTMHELTDDGASITSPYGDKPDFSSEYSDRRGTPGETEQIGNIIVPEDRIRGNYAILAELNSCDESRKAGPTSCVIDDNFMEAIQSNMTVIQAMNHPDELLKKDGIFGFYSGSAHSPGGGEPDWYNGDFPYRSIIILRKFRILPVGWELASQYIKDHPGVGQRNLEDMVSCFRNDDEYISYEAEWCEGLVDPDWVLKAPYNYCLKY